MENEQTENNQDSVKDIEYDSDEYENDENDQVLIMNRNQELISDESCTKIIAPGQGLHPIPWHKFPDLDELCFPSIFVGQPIEAHPKLTYSERIKSEARRKDRRSCAPQRMLFMAKCKLEKSCSSNINMCLRKLNKRNNINIKVKDVLDGKFINEAIKSNECYKVLSQIRSSPAYWERKKKSF